MDNIKKTDRPNRLRTKMGRIKKNVGIYRRWYHVRVQRSRPNDGSSSRVFTAEADMFFNWSYNIQQYSEGLRQTMDRIGVMTRQKDVNKYTKQEM